jgi:hypothetical protein
MPKFLLKRTASIAATFLVGTFGSLGILAASPQPAHAASCYYSSCYNVDPQTSGCAADAYTNGMSGSVEVRYSPSCRATWLRDSRSGGFSWAGQLTQYTYNSNKSVLYTLDFPWSGWNGNWTRMVPVPSTGYTQFRANGSWSPLFDTTPGL